ncbi:MAG: DUF6339 family protein [Cyanobacteria bacterium J06555_12]
MPAAELSSHVKYTHSGSEYAPTGGTHLPESALTDVRVSLLTVAADFGFPHQRTRQQAAKFDSSCAQTLYDELPISPGEAARNGAWSFLTVLVLPDIARWRYPKAGAERFIGGVRNSFQRLWWRAHVLQDRGSDDPFHLLNELDEDTMVGIMERPGISSNPRLALELGLAAVALTKRVPKGRLEDARRDALKRVRQRAPIVCFDALSDELLRAQISTIFEDAAGSFQ